MTSTANAASEKLTKFQALLRELFQFDCADLDFGIYRIMNHKRDVVEHFVTQQLPASVSAELEGGPLAQQNQACAALADAARMVRENIDENAIDEHGVLAEEYVNTAAGRRYLAAQGIAADGSHSRDAVEAAIYNHLYTFFSRYYEDGDFISKRRYSGNQRYAIPYNGEEVYLHWANSDQYYVKSDEHFRNYDWQAPNGVTVHFRIKNADVEQNNVKGERRFFVPRVSETGWDAENNAIEIPFEYRPLSASESAKHGKNNTQDKIVAEARSAIPERLRDNAPAFTALDSEQHHDGNGPVSRLEHHLGQYVRRNNSDFFIHKDLAGFLSRELDFYLKNEVLNLDNLAVAGQDLAEGWFQQIRLTKTVGRKIIDFLAQIEDFQKMLWEKRKFVTETQYCITLGSIAPKFYSKIVDNDAQWEEWRELLSINDNDRSEAFLQAHPTLPLDTRHFDTEFVDRLLASFPDLDGITDGLLVHGDNYSAISLVEEKFKRAIQCIYIDPPYNTDASAILYKNDYKDSSWLTLMENRLSASRALMSNSGVLCCAIDDEEAILIRLVLRNLLSKQLGIVAVRSNPAGRKSKGQFSPTHEYAFFFGNPDATPGALLKTEKEYARYPFADGIGRFAWNNLIRHGSGDRREDRPKLFYPIFVSDNDKIRIPKMEWDETAQEYQVLEDARADEVIVYPTKTEGGAVVEKRWHRGHQKVDAAQSEYRVRRTKNDSVGEEEIDIDFKIRIDMSSMPKTWWDDGKYASANFGARILKDLFGEAEFEFAKAIGLVEDCLRAAGCDTQAIVLDYFAGSGTTGHAVINLNRGDDGERKFILVEMGEYFDTVLLPRIKKVTFSPEWKNGKPQREVTAKEAGRSPRVVKYICLESYEDALDSIEFDQASGQLPLTESEGHLLKYMLNWETRDSETLLNPAKLTSPFGYRMRSHVNGEKKERTVGLPETFNYLLGLNVRQRQVYEEGGRRYLVYRGETRRPPAARSPSSGGQPKVGPRTTSQKTGTLLPCTTCPAMPIQCTLTGTRPSPTRKPSSRCSRRGCSPA